VVRVWRGIWFRVPRLEEGVSPVGHAILFGGLNSPVESKVFVVRGAEFRYMLTHV
jgi:hypothetical protein